MRTLENVFIVLFIVLFITACTGESGVLDTATPTQTLFTSTLTPTLRTIVTRTATPIHIPEGAGFVNPPVAVQFETSLESLPSGKYLIVRTMDDIINDATTSILRYISLDGGKSGILASISGNIGREFMNSGSVIKLDWWGDQNNTATLIIDLEAQKVEQFATGCPDEIFFLSSSQNYLAYQCWNVELIWYVLSRSDRLITAYQFPEEFGNTHLFFLTPDVAQITNEMRRIPPPEKNASCLFYATTIQLHCFDTVPSWWDAYAISPDGNSFLSADDNILPFACIENPFEDICTPRPVRYPSSEDVNFYSLFRDILWFPDGSKILFVQGSQDPWKTIFWIYDLNTDNSYLLGYYPDVIDPSRIAWVDDGEHFLVVDDNNPADQKVWLVSVTTGQMTRIASNMSGICNVVGVFQVP
jgi:hypothetical protein